VGQNGLILFDFGLNLGVEKFHNFGSVSLLLLRQVTDSFVDAPAIRKAASRFVFSIFIFLAIVELFCYLPEFFFFVPDHEQGAESPLVGPVETALMLMQEIESGCCGQCVVGPTSARDLFGEQVEGRTYIEQSRHVCRARFVHFLVKHDGFHGPDAAQAPESGSHFLYGSLLDRVSRLEIVAVLVDEELEVSLAFVFEDDGLAKETVTQGILGRSPFTFFRYRAARQLPVLL
jgi:hypothetical protein